MKYTSFQRTAHEVSDRAYCDWQKVQLPQQLNQAGLWCCFNIVLSVKLRTNVSISPHTVSRWLPLSHVQHYWGPDSGDYSGSTLWHSRALQQNSTRQLCAVPWQQRRHWSPVRFQMTNGKAGRGWCLLLGKHDAEGR